MNDDPRSQPDPLEQLIHDLDQHLASAPYLGKLLAGEWTACVAEGIGPIAAAVLIGTRWSGGQ